MYSDKRYSLTRYSLNQEGKTLAVEERFFSSLGASAGAAVPVPLQERFGEAVQGSARGTVSLALVLTARAELSASVRLSADVLAGTAFVSVLGASAAGRKDTPAGLHALDGLGSRVQASKEIPMALRLTEALSAVTAGCTDVHTSLMASEVLTALLSATSQTTQRAVFQLTIPPGGELRVDSQLFTVSLDGENALHTQSGDWVNLSRELLRLNIEAASGGGLQGQLIYTERYL